MKCEQHSPGCNREKTLRNNKGKTILEVLSLYDLDTIKKLQMQGADDLRKALDTAYREKNIAQANELDVHF
ncbi:MAG: hypothetical protein LAT84_02460 [Balneolia bacterium]|nr:hypothetical protein [Balneolia bacterium]